MDFQKFDRSAITLCEQREQIYCFNLREGALLIKRRAVEECKTEETEEIEEIEGIEEIEEIEEIDDWKDFPFN